METKIYLTKRSEVYKHAICHFSFIYHWYCIYSTKCFGSKTEGLSTKHTLYTIGSAIITIAIFISIGYAIQYLTAALYGL